MGKIEAEPRDMRSQAEPGNEINPLHLSSEEIEAERRDMRSQAEPGNEINPSFPIYASPTAAIKISIILIAINGATAPPNP